MKADLSTWYTEAEAAEAIECSVRNVQRYVAAGKIEVRKRPRDGKKPENVLNPRDVDALRPAAHIMPEDESAAQPVPAVQNSVQLRRNGHAPAANADSFFAFLSTITTAIATRQDRQDPTAKLWLTLDEAAEHSGLTPAYLRDRARVGEIGAVRGGPHGALRISRASLEAFEG